MGNDDGGAPFGYPVESCLNFAFGAAVECAGGFIEDQDWGIFEQSTGDSDALLFATRQFQPAFADLCGIAFWQRSDEVVDRCAACRSLDFLLPGTLTAIADIVTDTLVEQHRVLRHDTDIRAQRALGDVANILTVEQYLPAGHIIESVQQPCDCRFARARRSDNRQRPARRYVKANPFQDFAVGLIAEMHVLERQRAAGDGQRSGSRFIDNLALGIDQIEHRRHVGQPLANGAIDHAEHVERAEKLSEQRVYKHNIAGGELTLRPAPDRVTHRARQHEIGDQRLSDIQESKRVFRFNRSGRPLLHDGAVGCAFAAFRVEIFDRFVIQQAID